ncbi:hypothetical protein TREAZ_3060 [Leadbettera azotonutricia ZAS-9]|uniref:Uncharacterized protein n=1 Tax=Leadbettera azotonutricia (strain ATCC BAA-888 / DSM 13862 / ZAS-9) TaxID=545695 RepID=F5YAK5_LEAAZ|nr:hypothetical protein TREAZ_3060 [Leadbettera azotonutricia ZAS-9]
MNIAFISSSYPEKRIIINKTSASYLREPRNIIIQIIAKFFRIISKFYEKIQWTDLYGYCCFLFYKKKNAKQYRYSAFF